MQSRLLYITSSKYFTLLFQAVKYLQLMVVQARRQQQVQNENVPNNYQQSTGPKKISIDPKTWVKLGHFHLLLEEYKKGTNLKLLSYINCFVMRY